MGSIIYLKDSDVFPADVILLDSSEVREKEVFCLVSNELFNGKTAYQKKRASQLTQSKLNI